MLDTHTISTFTLIVTIIGSVLSSSVLSSIITGLFNNSSKDNEWRSQHLSQDKGKVREYLELLNEKYKLLEYKEYQFSDSDYKNHKWLLNILQLYFDINNPYSKLIYDGYSELMSLAAEINFLVIEYKHENFSFPGASDFEVEEFNIFINNKIVPLENKCDKVVNLIIENIGKYFAYYYPKPSCWTKIKKRCL